MSLPRSVPVALLVSCLALACGPVLGGQPRRQRQVDAVFAEYDRPDSPGCALGVYEAGEIAYARGYGVADLEHGVPIDADSVFRVGSLSKQFTAMVVLLLEQQGLLSLQDDVRRWLPELPDFGQPVRLEHLLHHTSGWRDYLELMALAGVRDQDYYDAAELMALLVRQRALNFDPGSRFLYSNTGYFLLGQVAERAAGQPLSRLAHEQIFEPLGMSSSHFHDDLGRLVPHRAIGYSPRPGGGYRIDTTTLPIVGDGGVFTSVRDLLAWDRNYYENRLGDGSAGLIARWLQRGVLGDGTRLEYAAGIVDTVYRGLRLLEHSGSFVGYRADLLRFPAPKVSVAVLCNVSTARPADLGRRVADVWLRDRFQAPAQPSAGDQAAQQTPDGSKGPVEAFPLAVADLRGYAGRYTSTELGVSYELVVRDARLVWRLSGRFEEPLAPVADDEFRAEWPARMRFARDATGRIVGCLLDTERVRNLWLERVD